MRLTVSSFLIGSCGACLFICAKHCCFYLGSLQQGMSSFVSEPGNCSKHSQSFKKATECAVLLEGDFDRGQICVQVVCEGGGPSIMPAVLLGCTNVLCVSTQTCVCTSLGVSCDIVSTFLSQSGLWDFGQYTRENITGVFKPLQENRLFLSQS